MIDIYQYNFLSYLIGGGALSVIPLCNKIEMGIKKTIAIVGATEKRGKEFAKKFSCLPYRLLLISDDNQKLSELKKEVFQHNPLAEIDTIECVKDGCWEADIILFAVAGCDQKNTLKMMKEVATQKIVIVFSDTDVQKYLPYSKVVMASGISSSDKIFISGNDEEINLEISKYFIEAGYQLKKHTEF